MNSRHQKALQAILVTRSIAQAARECGLSERTVHRYLELPDFIAALHAAEKAQADITGRRLLAGYPKALDLLEKIIDNPAAKDNDRRLAAVAYVDIYFRHRELNDLEDRIVELERLTRTGKND
jgi:hypothetical protein